jgi:CPA1 family monovalent cation:H+ antiporter
LGLQLPDIIRKVPEAISARHVVFEPIAWIVGLTLALIALRFVWSLINHAARHQIAWWRGKAYDFPGFLVSAALAFAGVRGAITLAGVLSIPLLLPNGAPFPGRDLCIFLAAGVIICSLLMASIALPLIARGITRPEEDPLEAEAREARVAAAEAAVAHIEQRSAAADSATHADVAARMIASYRLRIAAAKKDGEGTEDARAAYHAERELRLAAISAERDALRRLFNARKINDETSGELMRELALAEATLRQSQ